MTTVDPNSAESLQPATALQIPMLAMPGGAMAIADNSVDKSSKNYQAGFAAGQEEAIAQFAEEKAQIAAAGATLEKVIAGLEVQFQAESAALVRKILAATAPALARHSILLELYDVIEKKLVLQGQSLAVRVHPSIKAVLDEQSEGNALSSDRLNIGADDALNENAFSIQWENGGMACDLDALIADVLNLLPQQQEENEE